MHDAVIVSAVRTAVGKAPNGSLRGTRPDDLAAVVIAEALRARAGSQSVGHRRRDPRLRDAGSRTGTERGADRQPARWHSGRSIGGHAQSLLLVGTAGHRQRRRAHHVRLRHDHHRRRHRVDEPGPDGRQQDRAQSVADGQLSRCLHQHGTRGGEPRPRSAGLPRSPGRLRTAQPSAGDRRDRRGTIRGRDRPGDGDVDRRWAG